MAWLIDDPSKTPDDQSPFPEQSICSPICHRWPCECLKNDLARVSSNLSLTISQSSPAAEFESFAAIWDAHQRTAPTEFCHRPLHDTYFSSSSAGQGLFPSSEFQQFLGPANLNYCSGTPTTLNENRPSTMGNSPSLPCTPFSHGRTIFSRNEVSRCMRLDDPKHMLKN
jgi:hypothetical protein